MVYEPTCLPALCPGFVMIVPFGGWMVATQRHFDSIEESEFLRLVRTPLFGLGVCLAIVVTGAFACGGGKSPTQPTRPSGVLSGPARNYLEQFISFVQPNSINRLTIDWTSYRAAVFAAAAGAYYIADTYPAIKVGLQLLGDGRSSFTKPDGSMITVASESCGESSAGMPALPSPIGYVRVPAFSGVSDEATAFASDLQHAIAAADSDDTIGWIVDIRGNTGGNMWPMIAGLGPVLGDGVLGYFIGPEAVVGRWEYHQGASYLDTAVEATVNDPYRLRHPSPRVAVLIDNAVASSGEAVAIAFKRRADTRFFGDRTCGRTTVASTFTMNDNARLYLITATMADRAQTKYLGSVEPDETILNSNQLVTRTVDWLKTGN